MKHIEHPKGAKPMMRIGSVMLLGFALMLGGCLSRAPIKKETFAFNAPAMTATNGAAGSRVLSIRTLQIDPPFNGRALVYRTGEFSYERDPYAEFLGPPADGLATLVTEKLRSDGCFKAVVKTGSAARPDTLVEININELYGDIRKPGSPEAVLAMQVIFMNATNGLPGKVIFQQNYSRRIPMKATTPAALMAGWNQALDEIFDEVASDLLSREGIRSQSIYKMSSQL
ncbi:MAG TPA: ABC-type transport auxiliary lipoprotein family protein [Pseudomonadales bacterium]|nr:ABC-type transport auxiliary lipoprotein family protein [Pseudomonadales bacterium]